jgi:hypothetical protein
MPFKKFLFSGCFLVLSLAAFSQDSTGSYNSYDRKNAKRDRINRLMKMEEEGDLVFSKAWLLGLRLATDGYGVFFEKGIYKTIRKTRLYQFEFNEKKDPKDHKVAASGFNGYNFNSVVVGKLNNFYQFKAAYGQQYLIGGKANKNGVAVTAVYTGGISLGLLKPYYVNVVNPSGNTDSVFRSKYPDLIDSGYIEYGAAGFGQGLNQIKIRPGLNAKFALRFDYGRFNQSITAIEAGVTGEYFFSKIPMMYLVKEKNLFLNAYISIMFGKRK